MEMVVVCCSSCSYLEWKSGSGRGKITILIFPTPLPLFRGVYRDSITLVSKYNHGINIPGSYSIM